MSCMDPRPSLSEPEGGSSFIHTFENKSRINDLIMLADMD